MQDKTLSPEVESRLQELYLKKQSKMSPEEAEIWLQETRLSIAGAAAHNCEMGRTLDLSKEQMRQLRLEIDRDLDDDLVCKYAAKGITIEVMHRKVYKVQLQFTPEEWVNLLNKEGEHLPVCCGDISAVRDNLFSAIRENFFINVEDLRQSAYLLTNHDCGIDRDESDPLYRIVELWEAVKGDSPSEKKSFAYNPDKILDAVHILRDCLKFVSYQRMFSESEDENRRFIDNVNQQIVLARTIPALRTVYNHLSDLGVPEVRGWGIIARDGISVAECLAGPAVFSTREKAEKVMAQWGKDAEQEEEEDEEVDIKAKRNTSAYHAKRRNLRRKPYTVERVLISLDNGMKIVKDDPRSDAEWQM